MIGIIKEMFIVLSSSIVNAKRVSLNIQKCIIQPTLINIRPNEYSEQFYYYPYAVKLDRCVGYGNTFNDLSNKVYVPNKTKDLNLIVFNMITGINESKTLTKHISCECNCRFDRRKYSSDQSWNNGNVNVSVKKHHICEKDYVWNPNTCTC